LFGHKNGKEGGQISTIKIILWCLFEE
jgi:hypothetical protein